MKFTVIDTVLFLLTSHSLNVDSTNYVPVGCYKDNPSDRAMPEMIANYRVKTETWPDILNWDDLENSVIKKCAIKVREKGYQFFGVQFYGECWSGGNSQNTYAKHKESKKCTKSAPFVGKELTNFVYMLTAEDECQNYETLGAADRSKQHSLNKSTTPKCDNEKVSGFQGGSWYRFTGEAGDAMAKECVPPRRCKTYKTGWYNGSYPTVSDGIQTGKVCFSWGKNCCDEEAEIKIRNCSDFYVYKLDSVKRCMARYCGNGNNDLEL